MIWFPARAFGKPCLLVCLALTEWIRDVGARVHSLIRSAKHNARALTDMKMTESRYENFGFVGVSRRLARCVACQGIVPGWSDRPD